MKGEALFIKTTIGAFASTPLDSYLRRYAIEHLLLSGVGTHACVANTANFAAELGYYCVIVEDACSDWRREDHEWALFNFQCLFGGRQVSTDSVIAELTQVLGKGRSRHTSTSQ